MSVHLSFAIASNFSADTYQANLQTIAIKIIQYPIFCLVFQIMPEIMPRRESVASTPYYKNFMGIFVSLRGILERYCSDARLTEKIKRAIATWLLETDPESEDVDHEENQSAAPPSPGDTLPTAVPSIDRIKEWTVKYWRGNRPSPNSPHTPGGYSPVQESHLIDALWHNRSERRQIRVSVCLRIKKALRPHKQILVHLVDSPNEVDDAIIPAK
ncbi:hypothetical protein EV421DRAFT_1743466, partial [Armillaria borealis]